MLNYSFFEVDRKNTIAKFLLDINAVEFRPNDPFTLTSRKKSPVYVDVRKLISFPSYRSQLIAMICNYIYTHISVGNFDVVAGGESAGIPFAALVANRLDKPMVYIRKKAKKHGTASQIEGILEPGNRILLIEDLISYGTAKKVFIDAINNSGCIIEHILSIFSYGWNVEFPNITIHNMTDFPTLLDVSEDICEGSKEATTQIRKFLANPSRWRKPKLETDYNEEGHWSYFVKAKPSIKASKISKELLTQDVS